MSVCAIITEDPNCKATIKWLHQCYWIKEKGEAYCIFEFIIQAHKEALHQLSVHLPYQVTQLNDGCQDLIHQDNKPFYSHGYHINKPDPQHHYSATILLDGIVADVGRISISSEVTKVGSVINLLFSEPLIANDSRAVRIRYYCDSIATEKPDGSYGAFLEYYSSKSAALLNIEPEETISIITLFIWLIFPANTKDIYR